MSRYIEIDGVRYKVVKIKIKVKNYRWYETHKEWREVHVLEPIEFDGYTDEN